MLEDVLIEKYSHDHMIFFYFFIPYYVCFMLKQDREKVYFDCKCQR